MRKQQKRYGDLVNYMKAGLCFSSFLAPHAALPWIQLTVTIPISQTGDFQVVSGIEDCLSLSLGSVFVDGRSLGWL